LLAIEDESVNPKDEYYKNFPIMLKRILKLLVNSSLHRKQIMIIGHATFTFTALKEQ